VQLTFYRKVVHLRNIHAYYIVDRELQQSGRMRTTKNALLVTKKHDYTSSIMKLFILRGIYIVSFPPFA